MPQKSFLRQLNLTPSDKIREYKCNRTRLRLSFVLLVISILLFTIQIACRFNMRQIAAKRQTLRPMIAQTNDLKNQIRLLQTALDHEKQRECFLTEQAGIDPTSIIVSIHSVIPAYTTITNINVSLNELFLAGYSADPQFIGSFLADLQSLYGTNIRLITFQLKADDTYHFQIGGVGIAF